MKKTIFLTAVIVALFLAGCTNNNQSTTVQESNKVEERQTRNTITQEDLKSSETDVITEKTDKGFLISEAGVKIIFPNEYTITKNDEENRRGSFASYDFSYKSSLPAFQEIQFFNEKSIKQFAMRCNDDSPCFFGDYPDIERYKGQKNTFNN